MVLLFMAPAALESRLANMRTKGPTSVCIKEDAKRKLESSQGERTNTRSETILQERSIASESDDATEPSDEEPVQTTGCPGGSYLCEVIGVAAEKREVREVQRVQSKQRKRRRKQRDACTTGLAAVTQERSAGSRETRPSERLRGTTLQDDSS